MESSRTAEPLSDNDLTALAEYLEHADPAALHVPNSTVVRLLATLDAERHRADEAERLQDITFTEWCSESAAAHRKSLEWQLKAGRYFHERNLARAQRDLLERHLGEWWTQWTVGHRAADGVIDWGEPMDQGDARHYLTDERERWQQDVVLGARIVGDWYDAEPPAGPVADAEKLAEMAAMLAAALKDGGTELMLLPPNVVDADADATIATCPDCTHWVVSHYRGTGVKQGCSLCGCPLNAEAALGGQT